MADKMADRVKEVAVEEAEKIRDMTVAAAKSAAYLYPLRVSIGLLSKTRKKC